MSEERSCGVHRQPWQRIGRDVADEQVDLGNIAPLGQFRHLVGIVGLEQQPREARERATSDSYASDVLDVVAVTLHDGSARSHGDHDHLA